MLVLSWNVAGLPSFLWGSAERGMRYTPSYLQWLCDKFRPDVVCVQECFFSVHRNAISKCLPEYFRVRREHPRRVLHSGLETWIRRPHVAEECTQSVFGTCAAEDCVAAKGIQSTVVRVHGRRVTIMNVHMQNDTHVFRSSVGASRAQRSQYRALIRAVDRAEGTVVVTGDMNLHTARIPFMRFLEFEGSLRDAGLRGDFNDVENTWVRSETDTIQSIFVAVPPEVSDHPAMVSFVGTAEEKRAIGVVGVIGTSASAQGPGRLGSNSVLLSAGSSRTTRGGP